VYNTLPRCTAPHLHAPSPLFPHNRWFAARCAVAHTAHSLLRLRLPFACLAHSLRYTATRATDCHTLLPRFVPANHTLRLTARSSCHTLHFITRRTRTCHAHVAIGCGAPACRCLAGGPSRTLCLPAHRTAATRCRAFTFAWLPIPTLTFVHVVVVTLDGYVTHTTLHYHTHYHTFPSPSHLLHFTPHTHCTTCHASPLHFLCKKKKHAYLPSLPFLPLPCT